MGEERIAALLRGLPTRRMLRNLVRCVPQLDFMAGMPPTFLHASGRPNRCNPRGVDCLYFSEAQGAAEAEYRRQWRGTAGEHQPRLIFFARVKLSRIVDLENPAVTQRFRLTEEDLLGSWRLARDPTPLQRLGLAVSQQDKVTAIRFPSAAARAIGRMAWNVAIFPASVRPPDRVEILGNSGVPIEVLP